MNTHYFCTLFDSNYLLKGVAMLRSLKQHCASAHIYVLCMDEQTELILNALAMPHISCIALVKIEDETLLKAKKTRSVAEYCWTLSPCLPWYIMHLYPEVNFITYVDADLLFYSSLDPLISEISDASIAIIEHRFPPRYKHLEVNGRFCVEWVSFRRDEQGMACLARWREQCIEWCFYRLEDERMGDQKYLDQWPNLYSKLHILQHIGAGVAPWNYSQYSFGCDAQGAITVDGMQLIFYHFHQFQLLANGSFDRLSDSYRAIQLEPNSVYETYETTLCNLLNEIRTLRPDFSAGLKPVMRIKSQRLVQYLLPQSIKQLLSRSSKIHKSYVN